MSPPKDVKALLSFLQLCSWFRRFVPNFAEISKPLSLLTRKKSVWRWTSVEQQSFDHLKHLLTEAPVLRQADPQLPYIIRTDASAFALGACLLQGNERENEQPVEYASRTLTPSECNYSTTEREALAIKYALMKFRGYVDGAKVIIASDHRPLQWLMTLKAPTGRLARWAMFFQQFDLEIQYVPGRDNVVADMLSRLPAPASETEPNVTDIGVCPVSVTMPTIAADELREQQCGDSDLKKIIDCFEHETPEVDLTRWTDRGYVLLNGILYRYSADSDTEEPQMVVPRHMVPNVLRECHDLPTSGHYGIEKTIQRVSQRYYWSTLRRDVAEYVRKCLPCQRYKATNLKPTGLLQTPVMSRRFEVLAIDLVGPLPETSDGYRWVFCIEDTATRWMELFPLQQATAEQCAITLLDEVILRYGTPRKVISDNGVQFVSDVMQQVASCLGFDQTLIPVYHPAANPEERKNRDLKLQLSILVETNHDQWATALPAVRFAMNSVPGSTTGYSPAYLCFGRELRTADDVKRDLRPIVESENVVTAITPRLKLIASALDNARELQERHQDHSKSYADVRRQEAPAFEPGDKVLVTLHALSHASKGVTSKFLHKRDGPYLILRKHSPTSYHIATLDNPTVTLGVHHVSALRRFTNDEPGAAPMYPIRRRGRPPEVAATSDPPPNESDRDVNRASAESKRSARVRNVPSRYSDFDM